MDGGEEGGGVFGISCGNATPSFEVKKSVLDEMSEPVQIFVIRSLDGAVFLWWNDHLHALFSGLLEKGVAVITAVRQQMLGTQSFNQAASLRTIRSGTLRDNNSERHTLRIHGQRYLGVEPPLVRFMA